MKKPLRGDENMIDLKLAYKEVEKRLLNIDFNLIWPKFNKYKFALYDDNYVCIENNLINKTDEFIANTSIVFNNEHLAIWNLNNEMDFDILTSKIVHEMFHAFQVESKETRFPNEFLAVINYKYASDNLNIKLKENELIISLLNNFSLDLFTQLLSLKKFRKMKNSFEFDYEAKIEVIEGSALFVEMMVLKQLDKYKYENLLIKLKNNILNINNLIPIRIISYDIGALFLLLIHENFIKLNLEISNETYLDQLIKNVNLINEIKVVDKVSKLIEDDIKKIENLINNGKENFKNKITGEFEILGFNVYSARFYKGYLYTEYFLMYKDEKEVILNGNFLVKLNNNIIKEIYTL